MYPLTNHNLDRDLDCQQSRIICLTLNMPLKSHQNLYTAFRKKYTPILFLLYLHGKVKISKKFSGNVQEGTSIPSV